MRLLISYESLLQRWQGKLSFIAAQFSEYESTWKRVRLF